MKKRILSIVCVLLAISCLSMGVYATSLNEKIEVLLNRDLNVTYNGEKQTFVDVNKNTVYPLSYNGTTYLPVRAISGLLNLSIDYDSTTNTVKMGTETKSPTSLVTRPNSGGTEYSWIIADKSQLSFKGSDCIQTFESGLVWNQWNGIASVGKERGILFNVAGFSTLKFTVASNCLAEVRIYDGNFKVLTSMTLKAGEIVSKEINLNNVTKISIQSDCPMSYDKSSVREGLVYVYDPILS